jgi:hypothetical protein
MVAGKDWKDFQSCFVIGYSMIVEPIKIIFPHNFSLPLPVKMLPVTGKFKCFKLDHFTIFYLKLARKSVIFTPKLQVFFNPSNVLTFKKTAI